MEVAILTVGDEVLAGDTPNSNASWLAAQLTANGATVRRILTIPDEEPLIVNTVSAWRSSYDGIIVTGGLGGTHDDVTADAIAEVFDCELVVDDLVRTDVLETIASYRNIDPAAIDEETLELDIDAWAALPAVGRPILNPEGLCPGCVVENVYVFPGVPTEMQAMFESVAAEFHGDTIAEIVYTPQPEASMVDALKGVQAQFDISVGSYPDVNRLNRLKVSGTDAAEVTAALAWLDARIELVDPPEPEQ